MTCIAAVRHRGTVIMGCDSLEGDGSSVWIRSEPKVFSCGEALFGFAGLSRAGDVVRYGLEMPRFPKSVDTHEWLVTQLVPVVRELAKREGVQHDASGMVEIPDYEMLIGIRGELFYLDGDYHVMGTELGYGAAGSGAAYALGAFYATEQNTRLAPADRVRRAIAAASRWDPLVGGETIVMEA